MADPEEELIGYAEFLNTPCHKKPWKCQPRPISFVAFDADDTMWHIEPKGTIASAVRGPFVLVDPDTVEAGCEPSSRKTKEPTYRPVGRVFNEKTRKWQWLHEMQEEEGWWPGGEPEEEVEEIQAQLISSLTPEELKGLEKLSKITGKQLELVPTHKEKKEPQKKGGCQPIVIKLAPTMRETLDKLTEMKIPMAVISLNSPGSVKAIIDAFRLADRFVEIRDSWKNKGDVFEELVEKLKVNPCSSIFIDNMSSHVSDVTKKCGLGLVIGKEGDIQEPIQVLKFIEEAHG
jgi:FMN phosphatase YigB (HAD superfamily)